MEERQKKVLDRLQAQCSRREYCIKDIREKALKALDGDADAASAIIDSLVEERFVDELRYASAFAREKAHLTGWGPIKISAALRAKGIPSGVIKEALSEASDEEAATKLESVLRAKFRTLEGEPDAKLRLIKFALQRGYDYEQVRVAVDKII
ncbi:MAG: RecX family transcriptional regulator [Bacteroidales bacterium]|nr:RecX family transcriptional regulator [Bacteroidales bacterium]